MPSQPPKPTVMIPTDVHSFSRPFAEQHGATAAVLLKFLAYKVRRSKNRRDEKFWFYNSARKIAERVPYFSASTISAQVTALQGKGLLEIGNYNKWKQDRTKWFHVTEEVAQQVKADLISFDANVANEQGVLAAVLHYNLFYFIRLQVKKKVKAPQKLMSPKLLATLLPFCESAIKNALKKLGDAGLIVKCKGARANYTLPPADLVTLGQMG